MFGLASVWEGCFEFPGDFEGIESSSCSCNGLRVSIHMNLWACRLTLYAELGFNGVFMPSSRRI
jgi:hypothetical protein